MPEDQHVSWSTRLAPKAQAANATNLFVNTELWPVESNSQIKYLQLQYQEIKKKKSTVTPPSA